MEKRIGRGVGVGGECFERLTSQGGDEFRTVSNECRFVALAAVRNGCEVGSIGFEHEGADWTLVDAFADLDCAFKRGDAAERDQTAEVDDSFGIFPGANEAMEDRADLLVMVFINLQRIFKRCEAIAVAGMDDQVESRIGSKFEVLAQEDLLAFAEIRFDPAIGCRVVIIEPGLADSAYAWVGNVECELGDRVIGGMVHIAGMDADAGMHGGVMCNL